MTEEKTIFTIGINVKGEMNYHVDPEWLIANYSKDGKISMNMLALFGLLSYAKTELESDVYETRMEQLEESLEKDESIEDSQGGIDEIDEDHFNDSDDKNW